MQFIKFVANGKKNSGYSKGKPMGLQDFDRIETKRINKKNSIGSRLMKLRWVTLK